MAAAVGELGFAADATGGRVVLLLGLLTPRLRPDATHLLFVALKLLVQCSARRGKMKDRPLVEHQASANFFYLINFALRRRSEVNILTFIKTKAEKGRGGVSE